MADKLEFTSAPTEQRQPTAAEAYDELTALSRRTAEAKRTKADGDRKIYMAVFLALGFAVLFLSIALIVTGVGWSRAQGRVVPEIVTVEKETVIEVPAYTAIDPSVEYQTRYASEGFLLNDSAYGPIRMPILDGVKMNTYTPELFAADPVSGYMTYSGPESYMLGIDVSVHQGEIDWDEVKAAGFDFVMMRCGNRGYVTGLIAEDANFKANIRGALDAGLEVGVYFFSQALTEDEALEEAEFVIELLDGYDISFPVAFDWEIVNDPDGDTPRTSYLDPEQLTNNFLVFAQRLEMEGYTPAVYSNKKTAVWKYDLARIQDYDLWYAEYNDLPGLPYKWEMWQYSSKGNVPGINGSVDLNICFKDYAGDGE